MAKRNSKSSRPSHSKPPPILRSVVVTPLPSSFSMGFPQVQLRREISALSLNKEEDPSNKEKATFFQYYAGDACSSHGTFEHRLRTLPSEKDNIPGMEVDPIPLQDDEFSVLTVPPLVVKKSVPLQPLDIIPGGMEVVPIPLQDDDVSILDPPPPEEEEEPIHLKPLYIIPVPVMEDVLCGRGRATYQPPRNQAFRLLVKKAEVQSAYMQARKRQEKRATLPSKGAFVTGMEVVPIPLQDDGVTVLDPPPPEVEEPIHVEPQDVLYGRGGATNHHFGNQTFHLEKAKVQLRYLQADTRREKRAVAQALMDRMKQHHGSRFLDYCKKKKKWYIKSDKLVLEKIKQALRENLTEEERKEKREKHKRNKQLAQMQHSDCSDS